MTSPNLDLDRGCAAQAMTTRQGLDDDPTFDVAGR